MVLKLILLKPDHGLDIEKSLKMTLLKYMTALEA